MEKKFIDENNIANKYLRGQLTAEEIIEFESYFLDKPELVEKMEMDEVMIDALPQTNKSESRSRFAIRWFSRFPFNFAVSFIVILAVSIQLIYFNTMDETKLSSEGHVEKVHLFSIRSADEKPDMTPEIEPLMSDNYFMVTIQLDDVFDFEADFNFFDADSGKLVESRKISPLNSNTNLLLETSLYKNGKYILKVVSQDNVEVFHFKVKMK